MNAVAQVVAEPVIKLDIGCGKNKQPGHIGVDKIKFDGVDVQFDAGVDRWPYDDDSVEAIYTSHFVEHLRAHERIHFVNEAYRVLKKDCKVTVIVPHWASCRAYGDMTHQWPPVSEFWFYYLDKNWRASNAPHTQIDVLQNGYSCDFAAVWGYGMHPSLQSRNPEYQQFAFQNYKEAISDIHATLTARK